MEQVKVEIFNLTFFQLLLEYLLYLAHIREIVSRELIRELKAFARVAFQRVSDRQFRVSRVISPRGIIIIDPVLHCVADHFIGFRLIDAAVFAVDKRKPHTA